MRKCYVSIKSFYIAETLDSLQSLVESLFSDVRNIEKRLFKCSGNPCTEEYLQVPVLFLKIIY